MYIVQKLVGVFFVLFFLLMCALCKKTEERFSFEKSNHSMIFILLKEHVNCSDFVEKLTVQDFYLKFLKNTPVHVY